MALQGSGTITLKNVADEFDNSAPYSMSEFYRGGAEVPEATENANVPTSGAISLGDFYGATKRIAINYTISSSTDAGIDLKAIADANGYSAGITDVYLTIESGVYVGSPSDGESYAITADGFTTGDIVNIENNGYILGAGGNGGTGGVCCASQAPSGNAGGRGIYTTVTTNITNFGTIAGGGGGGGGGGACKSHGGTLTGCGASGGGAGAGYRHGSGGAGTSGINGTGTTGGSGGFTSAGSGGPITYAFGGQQSGSYSGAAGDGGSLGSSGTNGQVSIVNYYDWVAQDGGTGGAAGYYLVGNSNVTWVATGTRLGQVS
jgi:hypothetical protein